MDVIYKVVSFESKALEKEGAFEVLISSEQKDRDGDVLLATGARIDNYMKNPVVLYAHDYNDLPVAKATSIEAIPGVGLKAVMQFPPAGISAKADEVHGLWRNGFLNAASVGFVPLQFSDMSNEQGQKQGRMFSDYELLEFSVVPVPANANALRLSIDGVIEKRGRVLSASNEQRLRGAANMILEVLDQVATPPTEEEPIEDAENGSEQRAIADALGLYLDSVREVLK